MSKKRRKIAENWIATTESDRGLSLLHPARVVVCELRTLWAREKLLEAVVKAARNVMDLSNGGPLLLADALDVLDAYDKEPDHE